MTKTFRYFPLDTNRHTVRGLLTYLVRISLEQICVARFHARFMHCRCSFPRRDDDYSVYLPEQGNKPFFGRLNTRPGNPGEINAQGARRDEIEDCGGTGWVFGPDAASVPGSISRVNIGNNRTGKQNLAPRDYNNACNQTSKTRRAQTRPTSLQHLASRKANFFFAPSIIDPLLTNSEQTN